MLKRSFVWVGLALVVGLALAIAVIPTRAAGPWYVATTGNDDADCATPSTPCRTINGAHFKAEDGGTILVAVGVYTGTGSQVVELSKGVELSGGWNSDFTQIIGLSTIDGEHQRRGVYACFYGSAFPARISRFLITHGANGISGGGISYYCGPTGLTVEQSIIRDNGAGNHTIGSGTGGGGIEAFGPLTLIQSEVTGNRIYGSINGGGIYAARTLIVVNSTIHGNLNEGIYLNLQIGMNATILNSTITGNAYGVVVQFGGLTLRNSILAENTVWDCQDRWGTPALLSVTSSYVGRTSGCPLDSTDRSLPFLPRLGSLQDNGGPTATRALASDDLFVNSGSAAGCLDASGQPLTIDQRGAPRYGPCDPGAYESSLAVTKYVSGSFVPGGAVTYTLAIVDPALLTPMGAMLTDTLPAALTLVPGSVAATQGQIQVSGNALTWTGTVSGTVSSILSFQAEVDEGAPLQIITNTAQIVSDGFRSESNPAAFNTHTMVRLPQLASQYCGDFVDDFGRPSSGWFTIDSNLRTVEYLNGEYRVLSKQSGYLFLFAAPTCMRKDYVVEVDARWVGAPGSDLGVIFGADQTLSQFYLLDINTDTQQCALLRFNADGSVTSLVGPGISAAIQAGTGTNHIEVTRQVATGFIGVAINQVPVMTWSDSALTGYTWVGLAAAPYNAVPSADARFDNFRVIQTTVNSLTVADPDPASRGTSERSWSPVVRTLTEAGP